MLAYQGLLVQLSSHLPMSEKNDITETHCYAVQMELLSTDNIENIITRQGILIQRSLCPSIIVLTCKMYHIVLLMHYTYARSG